MVSGAAEEPVECVRPMVQEEMSCIRHEVELGVREVCSKVFAVGARDQHVQFALPEPHLGRHVGELENPRPVTKARSSSTQPPLPWWTDSTNELRTIARTSGRASMAWSGAGSSEASASSSSSGSLLIVSTCGSRTAVTASLPAAAAPNSSRFTSAMPAKKSKAASSDAPHPRGQRPWSRGRAAVRRTRGYAARRPRRP
jgi:hypothetical protein